MEETIGYEALFSPEEWDAIQASPWSDEGEDLVFDDISPDGDRVEDVSHEVTIYGPPGERLGNESRFELECDRCGDVGAADTLDEAKAIARLHESFVAVLMDRWEVQ